MTVAKLAWDEQVPREILNQWIAFCNDFPKLESIKIPRKTLMDDRPAKLVFCDASKAAYGCVIYGIQADQSSLLFSKVKVAPVDKSTLPSLELFVFLAY